MNLVEKIVRVGKEGFLYSPPGRMVRRNLEVQWYLHCVTMPRYSVFLADELQNAAQFLQENGMDERPFGIATIDDSKSEWNQFLVPEDCKQLWHRFARVRIVCDSSSSMDMFQRLQRERKVWWRRLAQFPSRFKLTESVVRGKSLDVVKIEAEVPTEKKLVVETLSRQTQPKKLFLQAESAHVHTIEHGSSLDWGCLALLRDAVDSGPRGYMQPRLAAHKVAFLVRDQGDDLDRFVLYLKNSVKARGVDAIVTNSKLVIDAFLVPFLVVVERSSLEDGILRVASRATTLAEQVHATDLPDYLVDRCAY